MNTKVLKELRVILACHIIEGYGLVESTICSLCSSPGDKTLGHVGGPPPGLEIKLAKLTEDFHFEGNNQKVGELCLRGDAIFRGYYNQEISSCMIDEQG